MMMLSWDDRGTLVPFSSVQELDELLERVASEAAAGGQAVVVTALDGDDPAGPALSIGCGAGDSVAVWRTADEHLLLSRGDRDSGEPVEFTFCGEPVKYPATALVPDEMAREAIRTFADTGTRPEGLTWQQPQG